MFHKCNSYARKGGICHKVSQSQNSPMSHCTSVPSWCMAGGSRHNDSREVLGALQTRISSCYILQDNHIKTLCKDQPCCNIASSSSRTNQIKKLGKELPCKKISSCRTIISDLLYRISWLCRIIQTTFLNCIAADGLQNVGMRIEMHAI